MATADEKKQISLSEVDWKSKASIFRTFPFWKQEAIRVENDKTVSRTVDIEPFTLQTPYKDKTLLKSTHLFLEPNKRHCLFGRNGTGKTLLFERMADSSIKGFPAHLNVHHCKEMEHLEHAENVLDTVLHSHEFMNTLWACQKKLKELIALDDASKAEYQACLDMVELYLRSMDAERAEDRAKKMLRALGFDEHGMARSTNDLSGGLRMRVALAVAFFSDADLLLLDEPTNHLDFPSVLWLENRLRGYGKSFLLVTHDRDLLVNVTTSVLLLEDGEIKYYNCGYGEFENRKAKEDQKKSDDIEKFLKFNRNADPSTPTGRRVADMKDWVQTYYEKQVQMQGKFTFPQPTPLAEVPGEVKQADGSQSLIKLTNVRFSYNAAAGLPYIFDTPINFEVTTKSRFGIMGPNGAGKSTLLKLLTKKLIPTEGTQVEHPNFILAYFGQHSTAELNMEMTPLEFMCEQFPDAKAGILRNHLQKTSISNGVESTRMMSLSYSQRSCVIFAKLTFVCPHLLIMDEPTNFLDIESVDSLIAAANKFPGALLVVTHSRQFLRKCAKAFLSIVPGQFLMFDNMKDAENATYTFIQELESGVKIDASQMSAGGGSLHTNKPKPAASAGGGETVTLHTAIVCPNAKFAPDEKVTALWTDKKWYDAVIVKIASAEPIKYSVHYPQFGKTATIPEAGIKKAVASDSKVQEAAAKEQVKANAIAKKEADAAAESEAAAKEWKPGDQCMAMGKDGRFVEAKVVKVNAFQMIVIRFEGATADEVVPLKKLRLFDAANVTKASQTAGAGRGGRGGGRGGGAGRGGR